MRIPSIRSAHFLAAALVLTLGACASSGPTISDAQLTELQKGRTTADDVVRRFGKPSFNSDNLDGTRTTAYLQEGTRSNAAAMVAVVGAVAAGGGSTANVNSIIFRFDTKGMLSSYERTRESQAAGNEAAASGASAAPAAPAAAAVTTGSAAAVAAPGQAATTRAAPAATTTTAPAPAAKPAAPRSDNLPSWLPSRESRDTLNPAH